MINLRTTESVAADAASPVVRLGQRRDAGIAFADIVGYSILMGVDGARTHARWMALLHGTLRPMAIRYGSQIVKSTGDGVVADFPDAAAAFAWAQAVQRAMAAEDHPDEPPIVFRLAIHSGEIYATHEDIYGDAVNLAARLQEHAPPGGIVMTGTARDSLSAPPEMQDLGVLVLRNITSTAHAYVLEPPGPVRVPMREPESGLPSVAAMPLENLGGDPADSYFAEGVLDDVLVSLGALRELTVLARGATLGWRGRAHDPRTVGRMLGVRYLLSGSVRRHPGRQRISVELRETEAGDCLWSDRIDAADHELFDVQDEIVARVVGGIAPSIRAAELRRALRRRPDSLSAYDLTLRAVHSLDHLRHETFGTARDHLGRALDLDPGFAMAAARASQWHSLAVGQAWSEQPESDVALAGGMAARAIDLDPGNALGLAMAGHYRSYHLHQPEAALPFLERAIRACPNHALAWTWRSAALSYLGRGTEALPVAERGMALSPLGPDRYYFQFFVGLAHYVQHDFAAAARWLGLSLSDNPGFTSAHRFLAAALVALGNQDEAARVAARMMQCEPGFRLSIYEHERAPLIEPGLRRDLIRRLRAAGLPR
ncbi:MAG: hypothetical protein IT556_10325 [Acetobacteraceae bacterium]|nr:hypothetical protein [Acetobacteraceae bacterium]